jgi:hypothetical protein
VASRGERVSVSQGIHPVIVIHRSCWWPTPVRSASVASTAAGGSQSRSARTESVSCAEDGPRLCRSRWVTDRP